MFWTLLFLPLLSLPVACCGVDCWKTVCCCTRINSMLLRLQGGSRAKYTRSKAGTVLYETCMIITSLALYERSLVGTNIVYTSNAHMFYSLRSPYNDGMWWLTQRKTLHTVVKIVPLGARKCGWNFKGPSHCEVPTGHSFVAALSYEVCFTHLKPCTAVCIPLKCCKNSTSHHFPVCSIVGGWIKGLPGGLVGMVGSQWYRCVGSTVCYAWPWFVSPLSLTRKQTHLVVRELSLSGIRLNLVDLFEIMVALRVSCRLFARFIFSLPGAFLFTLVWLACSWLFIRTYAGVLSMKSVAVRSFCFFIW